MRRGFVLVYTTARRAGPGVRAGLPLVRWKEYHFSMSQLNLVRHGQASFFEDDYDKLSSLGERQSYLLGEYWARRDIRFDYAFSGTLKRQIRTAEKIAEGFATCGLETPEVKRLPGLNEYEADKVMDGLLPEMCRRSEKYGQLKTDYDNAKEGHERYRTFHRMLEAVMAVWVSGEYDSNGFAPWTDFRDGVREALDEAMAVEKSGCRVLVVSSGGPVGVSVMTVLRAPDIVAAELNWRVYNCSSTEFAFTRGRCSLDNFNNVSHLTDPALLTYR